MNTQEIYKKEFINIFEVSHLFDVSGITARRYINGIFEEISLLESQQKTAVENDQALINQKIKNLSEKVRKRIIGKNKNNEDIFILEMAKKEALEKWELRPTTKAALQETLEQTVSQPAAAEPEQKPVQDPPTQTTSLPKTEQYQAPNIVTDIYGQKYITLLELQLTEKDNTIKDLRETNKFLSITNSKLNEQLRFLLEKPNQQNQPPQNI